MKKPIKRLLILSMLSLLIQSMNMLAALAGPPVDGDVVINPGNCQRDATRKGLRIDMYENGEFRVFNGTYAENYNVMQSVVRFGEQGNKVKGELKACTMTAPTGDGSEASPYRAIFVYDLTSAQTNRKYMLMQTLRYVYPSEYFFIDYEVIGDGTATNEPVHIFAYEDTAPGGNDNALSGSDGILIETGGSSTNYYSEYRPNSITMVYGTRSENDQSLNSSGVVTGPCLGISTGGTASNPKWQPICNGANVNQTKIPAAIIYKSSPAGFTSAAAGTVRQTKQRTGTGIRESPMEADFFNGYSNKIYGSKTCSDHSIAVHWNIGPLKAYESKRKRLMIGYGKTLAQFKAIEVVDQPPRLSGSTPVKMAFAKKAYTVKEGDLPKSQVKGIQVLVSGGKLNERQPAKIMNLNGTTSTVHKLVSGLLIPAGDYSNPQLVELDNLSISGNVKHEPTDLGHVDLGLGFDCGFLIELSGVQNTTSINIEDDDDIKASFEDRNGKYFVVFDKKVTFNQSVRVDFNLLESTLKASDVEDAPPWYAMKFIELPPGQSEYQLTPLKLKKYPNLLRGKKKIKVKIIAVKGVD